MNVSLSVYSSLGRHKLDVVARPSVAAGLGEYVLIEGLVLDVPRDAGAVECLRAAYSAVAAVLAESAREG